MSLANVGVVFESFCIDRGSTGHMGSKKVRKWMKINRVWRALYHQETELLVLFLWHWAAEGLDCL